MGALGTANPPTEPTTFPALRAVAPNEVLVWVKLYKVGPYGAEPVPLDYPFAADDRFQIEVQPSRGGYLALEVIGKKGASERRWPESATGHPLGAGGSQLIPPNQSLRFRGAPPTRLALLFSLQPLDGSGGPPATAGATGERRWLEQIRLRDVVADDTPLPETPLAVFRGALAPGEVVGVELALQHREGKP